jgi:hypothetical protein
VPFYQASANSAKMLGQNHFAELACSDFSSSNFHLQGYTLRIGGVALVVRYDFWTYLCQEREVVLATAVGGYELRCEGAAATHHDCSAVRKLLVGCIPPSLLQVCFRFHPVAISSRCTWSECPNLQKIII